MCVKRLLEAFPQRKRVTECAREGYSYVVCCSKALCCYMVLVMLLYYGIFFVALIRSVCGVEQQTTQALKNSHRAEKNE